MSNSKFQHPLTWYATHYAVSIATVKRWSARGLNLDDPHVIEWEVIGQKHEPPNLQTSGKAPLDSDSRAKAAAKLYCETRESFLKLIPIIAEGKNIEGLDREQTMNGHLNLTAHMLEAFWKKTVLILCQGKSREDAEALVEHELNARQGSADE